MYITKRATALKIVRELYAKTGVNKSVTVDSSVIRELLYYFAPKLPKRPTNILEWIWRCTATMDIREGLNHIYIDKESIYGSNGHIAASAPNTKNIKTGYYDYVDSKLIPVVVEQKYLKYPDVKSILSKVVEADLSKDFTVKDEFEGEKYFSRIELQKFNRNQWAVFDGLDPAISPLKQNDKVVGLQGICIFGKFAITHINEE